MAQMTNRTALTPKQAAACCAPIDALLDTELFRALGDGTRVRLLGCLAKCGRACAVNELAECCAVDLSVISRNLAQLERAGVVTSRKTGRVVLYAVRYEELASRLRRLAAEFEKYGPECGPNGAGGCCDANTGNSKRVVSVHRKLVPQSDGGRVGARAEKRHPRRAFGGRRAARDESAGG
jgi:ArsR family transcriptional regulator